MHDNFNYELGKDMIEKFELDNASCTTSNQAICLVKVPLEVSSMTGVTSEVPFTIKLL